MTRIKAICSYDGSEFLGYQKQTKGRTIQEEIEKILSKLLNNETNIVASGRTDAKVHAEGQVFHFDTEKEDINLDKFRYSMNALLPEDIHIISLEIVDSSFNARISATGKHYRYVVNMGEGDPFTFKYEYHLKRKLDIDGILQGCNLFKGEHDFKDFTSKEEDFQNFVRRVDDITIKVVGEKVIFDFYGNGFMRYMIRMMVGTLVAIGLDKEKVDYISNHLDSKANRSITSYKAPGEGLTLIEVFY